MPKFLFWNLNRKHLEKSIANLANHYGIDIFVFVECIVEITTMLETLNSEENSNYFYAPSIGCDKVTVYTKFSDTFLELVEEEERTTVRHLKLPGQESLLIVATHFLDKGNHSDASQSAESEELSKLIKRAEEKVGHQRTILVGDLNMNPFEDGVIKSNGLHAVMSSSKAREISRVVQNRTYPFFYNPMWNLLGDESPGPPGTYYYSPSEHKALFWNMFDQVLIRPEVIDRFSFTSLRILESDGQNSLLTPNGLPRRRDMSDHLPIMFTIDL